MTKQQKLKYYLESIRKQTALRDEAKKAGDAEEEAIAQCSLNRILEAYSKDFK
jgi:hypothetical protein